MVPWGNKPEAKLETKQPGEAEGSHREENSGAEPGAKDGRGDKTHTAAAADGGNPELEAEYTPRRLPIDEEECDEVAREALERLREQARALKERQREVEEREQGLKAREQAQARAAAQVEERMQELRRLTAELDDKIASAGRPPGDHLEHRRTQRARRMEQVRSVSRVVSGMTPQKAASLLSEMKDDELAVEVLQSLPQELAGKVLGQMRPASAARLAERIGAGEKEEGKP